MFYVECELLKKGNNTMSETENKSKSLFWTTKELLINDNRSISTISQGSKLPEPFLRMFRLEKTTGANVNSVQKLYEYLTETKLLS